MTSQSISSKKVLLLAALIGALLSYGVNYSLTDDSDQSQKIQSMQDTINNLESSLAEKEGHLKTANLPALHQNNLTNHNVAIEICKQAKDVQQGKGVATPNSIDTLKNLETVSQNDPRSYSEKLSQLLSGSPTREKIAIASKIIFDEARDQQSLPDYTLQSIYSNQTDPDLKRVIAQVLSLRGNDALLYDQIAQVAVGLKSEQARDRQDALDQLGKIHNLKAADAIVPFLNDPDVNVKLDALQALRNTGNNQDVAFVEMMRNDPNPAVSSLARDVVSDLKDLSSSARTTVSTSDIEAGLPTM